MKYFEIELYKNIIIKIIIECSIHGMASLYRSLWIKFYNMNVYFMCYKMEIEFVALSTFPMKIVFWEKYSIQIIFRKSFANRHSNWSQHFRWHSENSNIKLKCPHSEESHSQFASRPVNWFGYCSINGIDGTCSISLGCWSTSMKYNAFELEKP